MTGVFDPIDSNLHFSIRNSSHILCKRETFKVIVDFNKSGISNAYSNKAFDIARPRNPDTGAGAIIALGDSGLLGEPMCKNPGPGLRAGDNYELVKRMVLWLKNQSA